MIKFRGCTQLNSTRVGGDYRNGLGMFRKGVSNLDNCPIGFMVFCFSVKLNSLYVFGYYQGILFLVDCKVRIKIRVVKPWCRKYHRLQIALM